MNRSRAPAASPHASATLTKADIAREAQRLGLDAGVSHSCYDPGADGGACGACAACRLRAKGFDEAGIADPTRYAAA